MKLLVRLGRKELLPTCAYSRGGCGGGGGGGSGGWPSSEAAARPWPMGSMEATPSSGPYLPFGVVGADEVWRENFFVHPCVAAAAAAGDTGVPGCFFPTSPCAKRNP